MSAVFVILAHQLDWEGLRLLTAETLIRLSVFLGMPAARISFDTIEVQGRLIQFVASCTFAEIFVGCVPLIWRFDFSVLRNLSPLPAVAVALFVLNVVRLELGLMANAHGVPWVLSHDVPLGFVCFTVWVLVWRTRNWRAWKYRSMAVRLESSPRLRGTHAREVVVP